MRGLPEKRRSAAPNSSYQPAYYSRLSLVFNRVFTLTLSIGILGLTAYYTSSFKSSGSSVSGRLAYILACATLTLPISAYLAIANLPSSAPSNTSSHSTPRKGLGKLAQAAVDFLLMALWVAAAAVANGSATGFCTDGRSVAGLAGVMAFFFAWAGAVDLFTRAAE